MANESDINKVVGQRIRTLRKVMGLSQTDIASRVGFTYQQLRKYEAGENRLAIDTLERICAAFNTSTKDLVEGSSQQDISALLRFFLSKDASAMKKGESAESVIQHGVLTDPQIRASIFSLLEAMDAAVKVDMPESPAH